MAFEYGFYNSINGDRKYNAIQISQIFDGVIMDGVFASIGDKLFTTANGGMEIAVGTGKAWFNHTWNLNTTKMVFTLSHSHAVLQRYDAVVLEVNEEQDRYGRVNAIKVIEGTPSSNAIKPTMINTQYVHQYPLAYVKINAAAETITAANIEIAVGTAPCPFVTSVLQQTDITGLFANWNQQFNTWFDNLKAQLTDNVVTNLQNQIDNCLKPTDIATTDQIKAGTAGKLVDAAGLKNDSFDITYSVGDILYTRDINKLIGHGTWVYADGKLLRSNAYPSFRSLPSWAISNYVNVGNNISSSLNLYWTDNAMQLVFDSIILDLLFRLNGYIELVCYDVINKTYVDHKFTTTGLTYGSCSGIGSCARYQDGKAMFAFWAADGKWYVLECEASSKVFTASNWTLFSTPTAYTSVKRMAMGTMYRNGNNIFAYEENGRVIKLTLDYSNKALIVADLGLVTKNLTLPSGNMTISRCPAEVGVYNGKYVLPVLVANSGTTVSYVAGIIVLSPTTGLGIDYKFGASNIANNNFNVLVRDKTKNPCRVIFQSSHTGAITGGNLSSTQFDIGTSNVTISIDQTFSVTEIPNDTYKWVAIAAFSGGYIYGMAVAATSETNTFVYSEHFKCFFLLNDLGKSGFVNGTNIVWHGLQLDYPITWPTYIGANGLVYKRPNHTRSLYGGLITNEFFMTPYAVKTTKTLDNGSQTEIGTCSTYFPNYRLPNLTDYAYKHGTRVLVKVAN